MSRQEVLVSSPWGVLVRRSSFVIQRQPHPWRRRLNRASSCRLARRGLLPSIGPWQQQKQLMYYSTKKGTRRTTRSR
eukprot:640970-Hanusia_phi.AAC.1